MCHLYDNRHQTKAMVGMSHKFFLLNRNFEYGFGLDIFAKPKKQSKEVK